MWHRDGGKRIVVGIQGGSGAWNSRRAIETLGGTGKRWLPRDVSKLSRKLGKMNGRNEPFHGTVSDAKLVLP